LSPICLQVRVVPVILDGYKKQKNGKMPNDSRIEVPADSDPKQRRDQEARKNHAPQETFANRAIPWVMLYTAQSGTDAENV
jgi:hypothetical protein